MLSLISGGKRGKRAKARDVYKSTGYALRGAKHFPSLPVAVIRYMPDSGGPRVPFVYLSPTMTRLAGPFDNEAEAEAAALRYNEYKKFP